MLTLAMGLVCWWVPGHAAVAPMDAPTQPLLTYLFLGVALLDISLIIWLFLVSWQPIAEKSLKKVWAGRLLDPAEGKVMGQTLLSRSIVIMGLCEAPAVYAVLLIVSGTPQPGAAWSLVGISLAGLLYFRWQGLEPATDIFQQIDRIAQP